LHLGADALQKSSSHYYLGAKKKKKKKIGEILQPPQRIKLRKIPPKKEGTIQQKTDRDFFNCWKVPLTQHTSFILD
jgi:hypothetical protein